MKLWHLHVPRLHEEDLIFYETLRHLEKLNPLLFLEPNSYFWWIRCAMLRYYDSGWSDAEVWKALLHGAEYYKGEPQ